MSAHVLDRLAVTVHSRRAGDAGRSYTRQLLDAGAGRCAKKFGEEAVEVVIAGASGTDDELTAEAADVLYHLLVLLEAREVPLANVYAALETRMGLSGLDEKASRGSAR